jgi:hypothetical protein
MNETEQLADGTILMTVKVDGVLQKRRCYRKTSGITHWQAAMRLVPVLSSNERLLEVIGGEVQIITVG